VYASLSIIRVVSSQGIQDWRGI